MLDNDLILNLELQEREIPEDDPRLSLVTRIYNNLRVKSGGGGPSQL